jgi:hypothetical protein
LRRRVAFLCRMGMGNGVKCDEEEGELERRGESGLRCLWYLRWGRGGKIARLGIVGEVERDVMRLLVCSDCPMYLARSSG